MKILLAAVILCIYPFSSRALFHKNGDAPIVHSIFDERQLQVPPVYMPFAPFATTGTSYVWAPERKRLTHEEKKLNLRIEKGRKAPKFMIGGGVAMAVGIGVAAIGLHIASKEVHPLTSGYLVTLGGIAVTGVGFGFLTSGIYYKIRYGKYAYRSYIPSL